jgi:ABC-type transport system involved in cytochrome c biogenesis permease component
MAELPGVINPEVETAALQGCFFVLVLLGLAFVSARSFREERQNGVWESLMVSPLTTQELITGRLRGIWNQFAWPLLATVCTVPLHRESVDYHVIAIMFFTSMVAVPLVGICLALRLDSLLVAWLGSFAFAVMWPVALTMLAPLALEFVRDKWHWQHTAWLLSQTVIHEQPFLWFWVAQVPAAIFCAWLAFRQIRSAGSGLQAAAVRI